MGPECTRYCVGPPRHSSPLSKPPPQLVQGPHPLSGLVVHSLTQECPSSVGQEVPRKGQGSRSSCFLIFNVTVSPATCRRWMASLRGRPLRLTLLMASMRSPTWMAPVLRSGQSTNETQMLRASDGVNLAFKYPAEAPRPEPGWPQFGRRRKQSQAYWFFLAFPVFQRLGGKGIIRSCLREVGREGMSEGGERKRSEGSMSASELPWDNSPLDSTRYTST